MLTNLVLLSFLQTLDIMRFREHLESVSEKTLRITYPELLQMCKDRCRLASVASSSAEQCLAGCVLGVPLWLSCSFSRKDCI